jgi:hypothetical protein
MDLADDKACPGHLAPSDVVELKFRGLTACSISSDLAA